MVSAAVVLWSMVNVATTDPGIIPRSASEPFDLYDPNDPIPDRIRTKQILVNNRPVNLKYCRMFQSSIEPVSKLLDRVSKSTRGSKKG